MYIYYIHFASLQIQALLGSRGIMQTMVSDQRLEHAASFEICSFVVGFLLWLLRLFSVVPSMLPSTCLSLKSPIIRKEVALADLMAFTLSMLEITIDPLNSKQSPQTEMGKVAETYKVRFVVNVSEQGEDGPLAKNASRPFLPVGIPCYTLQLELLPIFFRACTLL